MPREIKPHDLAKGLETGGKFYLLDVRQPWEHQAAKLRDSVLVPMNELPARYREIEPQADQTLVVYCHHGARSWNAAAFLEQVGFKDVLSLQGGIEAWSSQVDPTVPHY